MFLKTSQISQENKVLRSATLLKRESKQVLSCEMCEIFENTYLGEHLRTAASEKCPQNIKIPNDF